MSGVMSDKDKITFGQKCESMKLVHKYLKGLGIDAKWKDDEFDEPTCAALVAAQSQIHAYDFIPGGGFNSDSERYKQGNKVIVRAGAKYYSSSDAEEPAGIVTLPTTGILKYNADKDYGNYYDENGELQFGIQAINVLKISLMPSPLKKVASSLLSQMTGSSDNKVSATGKLLSAVSGKSDKSSGGYQDYSTVYMRKEDVCPSLSDLMIAENLQKVMKAGEIVSKGIEIVNEVTDIATKASEFMSDASSELNKFLNNSDKERSLLDKESQKKLDERRAYLSEHGKDSRRMTFNQNGMFIKNLITDTIIYIPFRPESVDESYTVNWEEANTRGSSHQVFGYESTTGSAPSLNFEFDVGALVSYLSKNYNQSIDRWYKDISEATKKSGFFDEIKNQVLNIKNEIENIKDKLTNFSFLRPEEKQSVIKSVDQITKLQIQVNESSLQLDPNLLYKIQKLKQEIKSASQITNFSDEIFNIVNQYLNAIKALAYPRYDNGIVTPPSCYVSIANNFRFVGICNAVNISHKGALYAKRPDNYLDETNPGDTVTLAGQQIYMNYSVTLNFNKISNQDFSADTVELYGDNWTGGQSVLDSGESK